MNIIKALITQCGKTINAPANMILPMTKTDADFYALRSARAASQSPAEAQSPHQPRTAFEARGGKASS